MLYLLITVVTIVVTHLTHAALIESRKRIQVDGMLISHEHLLIVTCKGYKDNERETVLVDVSLKAFWSEAGHLYRTYRYRYHYRLRTPSITSKVLTANRLQRLSQEKEERKSKT